VAGGFEVRYSEAGVPIFCARAEPKWAEPAPAATGGAGTKGACARRTRGKACPLGAGAQLTRISRADVLLQSPLAA